jgi:3-deoxy-D-manno-octulosonic-acid transferase
MVKRLLSSRPVVALASAWGASYIRFVRATSTVVCDPADIDAKLFGQHPQIFAMWHGQFSMLPTIKPDRPADVVAMVARHGDAELIGSVLKRFDMTLIRGAGAGLRRRNRGGAGALRESVRALARGITVAMTADIPPGPARQAGDGIVMIARLSGRPIVPCAMATSRFIALRTWSAFTINLPFSTLGIVVGDPIWVATDADAEALEAGRLAVERGLNEATARAYALAGATDPLSEAGRADAAKRGFTLSAYRALMRLAAPLAPLMLAWRTSRGKEELDHRPERYGETNVPRPAGFLVWFHAASVGETNAVLPVIDAIASDYPDVALLLTTGTVTSARLARARLPKSALHQYVPLDHQDYVRKFLDHWRPDLAAFVESEIWPNLVLETKARGVPMVLVNGRMSFSSFRRWRKRPGLSKPLFSAFSLVLAQNERLAQRFTVLGAPRALGVGNLKADAPPPPIDLAGRKGLAAALAGRTVWLAASTHSGEDDMVALAHLAMKKRHPDLLTVIVPRHIERGPEIAMLCGMRAVRRRALGELPSRDVAVYVADTMGELGLFYRLTTFAFIGGSLVRHGGQNPLESARLSCAVLAGPHTFNFTTAYRAIFGKQGLGLVQSSAEIADLARLLLCDPTKAKSFGAAAASAAATLGGAVDKTVAAIEQLLRRHAPA